jgi:hypothetical protein
LQKRKWVYAVGVWCTWRVFVWVWVGVENARFVSVCVCASWMYVCVYVVA